MTRPNHPLQGRAFEVVLDGPHHLAIRLPDSSSLRILRSWTDVDGTSSSEGPLAKTALNEDAIRELLELIDALKRRG